MTRSIAVFGGSFDPPHVAHVLVAAYVLATSDVDELLVVPTFRHPFAKHFHAPFEHRAKMCELAFRDVARTSVSRIEETLPGESFTLHTLRAIGSERADASLRLVMGEDLLAETDRWHAWDEVRALAPPLIVGRAGTGDSTSELALPEVSSTTVRKRLGAGEDVGALVPLEVARYVARHRLYVEG